MTMKPKQRVLAIMLVTGTAMALANLCQVSEAVAETKVVEIIKKGKDFVLKDVAIDIQAGGTVEWIVKNGGLHQLEGDTPNDAIKNTGDFTTTVKQTFDKAGVVNYHCIYHDTMKGKITVK